MNVHRLGARTFQRLRIFFLLGEFFRRYRDGDSALQFQTLLFIIDQGPRRLAGNVVAFESYGR